MCLCLNVCSARMGLSSACSSSFARSFSVRFPKDKDFDITTRFEFRTNDSPRGIATSKSVRADNAVFEIHSMAQVSLKATTATSRTSHPRSSRSRQAAHTGSRRGCGGVRGAPRNGCCSAVTAFQSLRGSRSCCCRCCSPRTRSTCSARAQPPRAC